MLYYLRYLLLIPIKIYQKTLSPDHGPLSYFIPTNTCKFQPTCSQYSFEAIKEYGILKGVALTAKRLAKCHPWGCAEYDPVPKKMKHKN